MPTGLGPISLAGSGGGGTPGGVSGSFQYNDAGALGGAELRRVSATVLDVGAVPITGAIGIPAGTTAQQPGSPITGYMRFNTTTGFPEVWDGAAWDQIGGGGGGNVTGPAGATDNALTRFSGVTGLIIKNSTATLTDAGVLTATNFVGGGGSLTGLNANQLTAGLVQIARGGTATATANNNVVWAGPTAGGPLAPSFRLLVAGDIPSLSGTYLPLAGGTMTGAILFTDNAVDIGATGATRPRTLFLGTSLVMQSGANTLASFAPPNYDTASGALWRWSSSATAVTPVDTGFARNAAGVVEINNGTAGTLRDLTARTVSTTGVFAAAQGSASIPTHSFTGFTQTGMYVPSGTTLGFSVVNNLVLTLSGTGNTSNQPLFFSADNANDIGQTGALRPRTIFVGTSVVIQSAANTTVSHGSTNLDHASGVLLRWSSSATAITPIDTGLARGAAGVVEINSGTAAALRDLSVRTVIAAVGTSGVPSITFVGNTTKGLYYDTGNGYMASPSRFNADGGLTTNSGQFIGWSGATTLFNVGTTALAFNGTTASFPMLKQTGTTLAVRLADDTGDAPLTASNIAASGILSSTSTSHMIAPVGTTGQRPSNTQGFVRYNSTLSALEYSTASAWVGLGVGKGLIAVTLLTGSGTFTPNASTTRIIVEGTGAGGGGGGAGQAATASGAGGGGGSGAYARVYYTPLLASETFNYVCATGGAGGLSAPGNGGNGSANSTFVSNTNGNSILCPPGFGGVAGPSNTALSANAGGAGGTVATSTLGTALILAVGAPGTFGLSLVGTTAVVGGHGAYSLLGLAGGKGAGPVSGAGGAAPGGNYGAGGAGASSIAASANQAGGAGANGAFIVYEYG